MFDLVVLHRNMFALRGSASELISLRELTHDLTACVADDAAVMLRIHVARRIDRTDIRLVPTGLIVVVLYGLLEKGWLVTLDRL